MLRLSERAVRAGLREATKQGRIVRRSVPGRGNPMAYYLAEVNHGHV